MGNPGKGWQGRNKIVPKIGVSASRGSHVQCCLFDIYLDSGEEGMMGMGYLLVQWGLTTDVTDLRLLTVSSNQNQSASRAGLPSEAQGSELVPVSSGSWWSLTCMEGS